MQNKIYLSVVIASIPERFDKAIALYRKLNNQINALEANKMIELIMFTDNRIRSIGGKRQECLRLSQGDYIMYLDDDEDAADNYISEVYNAIRSSPTVDVITFKSRYTDDHSTCIIDMDLNNPTNEQVRQDGFGGYLETKRTPWHVCAWRSEIAKSEEFAMVGYGEDWDWVSRILPKAKTQVKIDFVLHHYIWSKNTSAAPTESNEVWTNPNEK